MTRLARFVVVAVVVLAGVGGAVSMASASGASASASGSHLTLSQIQGHKVEQTQGPPSERVIRPYKVRLWHHYANPLKEPSHLKSWQVVQYLRSGKTMRTDKVELRFLGPLSPPSKSFTMHEVSYNVGTKTVSRNGSTSTTRVAENVSQRSQTFHVASKYSNAEFDLPRADSKQHVLLYMTSNGREIPGAAWYFSHKSSAAVHPVSISNYGQLAKWVLIHIFGPAAVLTLLAGWAARKLREKAHWGPQWGYFPYILIGIFGSFGIVMFGWTGIASVWYSAPYVFVSLFGLLGFVQQMEGHDDGLEMLR